MAAEQERKWSVRSAPTILVAGVLASGAFAVTHAALPTTADVGFWSPLRVVGDEVEGYDSVLEMAKGSDLVVVGRLENVRLSHQVQGDAPGDVVSYASADVVIADRVRGSRGGPIEVEFLLPHHPGRIQAALNQLARYIPRDDVLLMLRSKSLTRDSRAVYRLVNSSGVWMGDAQGRPWMPLADEPTTARYATEMEGMIDLQEVSDYVR